MSIRARQEVEARIALAAIRSLLDAGFSIIIDNGVDTLSEPTRDLNKIVAEMMTVDEEVLMIYKSVDADRIQVGWIKLVYGNSGYDVISDHSMSLEPYLKGAEALSDYYSVGYSQSDGNVVIGMVFAEQEKERKSGAPGAWTFGDYVTGLEDARHIGRASIPESKTEGVADVYWEGDLISQEIPLDKLKLHHRSAYHIAISEYQRERVAAALDRRMDGFYSTADGTGDGAFDSEQGEMRALLDMLQELPEQDAKLQPGCLHGLCL